jgi:cell division protease FtsH
VQKSKRKIIVILAVAVFTMTAVLTFGGAGLFTATPERTSTSKALQMIDSGTIAKAAIADDASSITLTDTAGKEFTTHYPREYSDQLLEKLLSKNVSIETTHATRNIVMDLLGIFAPVGVLVIIYLLIRPDALKKGKFTAQPTIPETRFEDIAGADEAVAALREMVQMTKDGKEYARMGAHPPKGAILVGPSGTGKTLLARAVAGESGMPFYAVAGSDFVEMFAGQGPRRVRRLFDQARKTGGVIFIDEMDAIGQKRDDLRGSGDGQERLNVITALLDAMDGFTPRDNVIVLAATNRVESMDPALLRPGRLDRQIHVPLPDKLGREQIFGVHLRGKTIDGVIDARVAAAQTAGMSGAEIKAVVNEACMIAVRAGRTGIDNADIQEAVNVVAMGNGRKSAYLTPSDRWITAVHEAGHAACGLMLARKYPDHAMVPSFVTIIPRGRAGGFTRFDEPDGVHVSRRALLNRLVVSMGGRAAELQYFGEEGLTSGSSGDLQHATSLAREMVSHYGMAPVGTLAYADESTKKIDEAVEHLLREALAGAVSLIGAAEGAGLTRVVAKALLEHESLGAEDLRAIVDRDSPAMCAA